MVAPVTTRRVASAVSRLLLSYQSDDAYTAGVLLMVGLPANPLWLAVIAAVGVVLLILMPAWHPSAATGPQPAATVEPALTRLQVQQPGHDTPCWVSGDLVGDANPADVRRARCQEP
jgi:hypothetical protein